MTAANDLVTQALTTSALARLAGCPECRIRKLADLGLIPHVRDNVGRRLFAASAAEQVRMHEPLRRIR
jgi:DNA-binding transcriptional MerR regulator